MNDNGVQRPGTAGLVALVTAPVLTMVAHLVQVAPAGHDTASELASIAEHSTRYQISGAIGFVALVLWIPAFLTLAAAARARCPRLTAVGITLSLTGLMALASLMGSGPVSQALAEAGQRAAMVQVTDRYESLPLTAAWMMMMLVGFVLGLVVLGFALWRAGYSWVIPALLVAGVVAQAADAGAAALTVGFLLTASGTGVAAWSIGRGRSAANDGGTQVPESVLARQL